MVPTERGQMTGPSQPAIPLLCGVQGEKAMWPVLPTLKCHCRVELELADCATRLQRQTRAENPGALSALSGGRSSRLTRRGCRRTPLTHLTVETVSKTKELKRRYGAKRESFRPVVCKPCDPFSFRFTHGTRPGHEHTVCLGVCVQQGCKRWRSGAWRPPGARVGTRSCASLAVLADPSTATATTVSDFNTQEGFERMGWRRLVTVAWEVP